VRILVLAVPIGAGHIKVATAVTDAIQIIDPLVRVRLEDCFKWVWSAYGYAYKKIYDYGQLHSHRLLKILYGGVGVKQGSSQLLYWFHKKTAARFRRLLLEFRPDYVICAHFSPAYYASVYKREFGYRLGVVVTDYFVHPHWINDDIDHYFIPHESLIQQMRRLGARPDRIFPMGLPVNPVFDSGINVSQARQRFAIDTGRIAAVVMGSRVFGGEWFELVREIVDFDYDLFVLCGENKDAMKQIMQLQGRARLTTLGMVDQVYELMAACEILMTKAGGITSTEATKIGPCLLFANSIPGLEDKNEDFFVEQGAAQKITVANARLVMEGLLSHPNIMKVLRQNLRHMDKGRSAENIARVILS
jgi:processive 1,2-diacylglycerol beta-glucosyltransferase